MNKDIQGVNYNEFAVVGGLDDLTKYMIHLICDDDWEIPDRFLENHSIWNLVNHDLEFEGYVLVLEDHGWNDDVGPGASFGRYGLRLDKPRRAIRDFARSLIIEACQG